MRILSWNVVRPRPLSRTVRGVTNPREADCASAERLEALGEVGAVRTRVLRHAALARTQHNRLISSFAVGTSTRPSRARSRRWERT